MRIAIYHGKNEGMRSLKILADDLCDRITGAYPVQKVQELKGADVILNIVIEDIPRIEEGRRFIGYGKQVCFFTSNAAEHTIEKLAMYLLYCRKIPLVVHSFFHYDEVSEALKVFTPAIRRMILKNTTLNLCGITEEFISERINDKNKWIVPYNRANKGQKNLDMHIEVTNKVCAAMKASNLPDPTQTFYLLDSENFEDLDSRFDLSNYELKHCPSTREQYVQNCKEAGVFICTSNFESFGLMYIELLACGVVGIFLEKSWILKLLPMYKLIATKKEMPSMILAVLNDYENASKYVHDKVIPHIEEKYTFARFAEGLHKTLELEYERSRKD